MSSSADWGHLSDELLVMAVWIANGRSKLNDPDRVLVELIDELEVRITATLIGAGGVAGVRTAQVRPGPSDDRAPGSPNPGSERSCLAV